MTSHENRSHWDLKYEQGLPSLEKPDPFPLSAFSEFVADQFPQGGRALDLAGGIGRHALWLAKRNWQVTVVDISEVAIRKLDQKARQLDLKLDLLALDAAKYGSIAEFVGEGAVEKTRRLEIPQEGRDFHFSHRACGEGIEQLGRTGRNEEPLNSSSTV